MAKGYLALVLHAHLPFVRHPEHEDFLEEDWLYEALTETYIPLIKVFEKLIQDGIDFRVTLSVSPTLLSMLIDPLLQERYLKHLNGLIELSGKEIERTRHEPHFNALAWMYHHNFIQAREHRDIVRALKHLQDSGKVELITCAGTHCFLPLQEMYEPVVRAQVRAAVNLHQKVFGRKPLGMWLPECGYQPGHDVILKEEGIRYFLVDTHGILHGSPRPKYGIFAPVYCPTGVAAFGRDVETSRAVWSAKDGYPGGYNYREFYRDIGFDLDYDYIRPYIHTDGTRINTGIKYYRISGRMDLSQKQPYVRQWALDRAADHAGNFLFNRAKQVEHLHDYLGRKPIVVSPYDAELYGHWWYEGPDWLNFLFRKMHYDQDVIKPITLMEYLEHNPKNQVVTPSFSSWGWKGYSEYWLEGSNDWVYRHLHQAADRMVELAKRFPDSDGILRRGLNQAARELLQAQSSDWAFIMKTGTRVSYAVKRTNDHLGRFNQIYEQINNNSLDGAWLADIEYKDNIFQQIDYR